MKLPQEATSLQFLEHLLKLRLVLARLGEAELNAWWGTQDVLGPTGELVFRRGFPRTHAWAQAQVVFQMARRRCSECFPNPRATTLWQLPAAVEDAFEQQWNLWLDTPEAWSPLFLQLQNWQATAVTEALQHFGLVTGTLLAQVAKLPATGPSVPLVSQGLTLDSLSLLALAFSKGTRGQLVVPYLQLGND